MPLPTPGMRGLASAEDVVADSVSVEKVMVDQDTNTGQLLLPLMLVVVVVVVQTGFIRLLQLLRVASRAAVRRRNREDAILI